LRSTYLLSRAKQEDSEGNNREPDPDHYPIRHGPLIAVLLLIRHRSQLRNWHGRGGMMQVGLLPSLGFASLPSI
jgi:hypothetical protein